MTSIRQRKTTNLVIHVLLFIISIVFCTSTFNMTNVNSNETIDYDKLISSDFNFLKNQYLFEKITYSIEHEKNFIIDKKSLVNFDKTITFKFIREIFSKVITSNYEIMPMKKTNEITNMLIMKICEIYNLNINNNFFNVAIFYIIGIYSNYKNNFFDFENFNKKIIPIIYEIIEKHNIEYNNNIKNSRKYNILNFFIHIFIIFTEKKTFFYNLVKNEKLKELFINIIDKYIIFIILDENFINNYEILINNFFNYYVLENVKNNYYCKNVFFEILYNFLKHFEEILNSKYITTKSIDVISCFLDKLFKSEFFLVNFINKEILLNIFKKIAYIELENNKKEVKRLSIYTIQFYIKYIATISRENDIINSKIIENFEINIEKLLNLIKSFEIKFENLNFHEYSYYEIYKFLYDSNINFENDQFNNQNLIKSIKNTFNEYIKKIVFLKLENNDYIPIESKNNFITKKNFSFSFNDIEKFDFKSIISFKVINLISQFNKAYKNQELLENIFFSGKDKNLLKFALKYKFININEIETRNLLLDFFKIYIKKIQKSSNNVQDLEIFIVLSSYIIYFS